MAAGKILRDFSAWTSAHGIPHIGSAQNNCLRVFWAVIFFSSTCMFIFQMVLLIDKYTSYDVTVQTELKFEERAFPTVTLCNLNPYRNSTLGDSPQVAHLNMNDSIAVQSKAREHLLYLGRELSDPIKEKMSYYLEDTDFKSGFVLDCAFNTRPCNISLDFSERFDPIYGKCFTFNFNATKKSSRAGPLYGLRLLAVSNQDEYLPLTESAGIRVAVHGATEQPFPDAFGYNAAAGFTTSFGIKFIRTHRLSYPYGNCTDKQEHIEYFYEQPDGTRGTFQVEGCFRSCYQKYVVLNCSCADPRFALPKQIKGYDKKPAFCTTKDNPARKCVNDFSSGVGTSFNVVQKCTCPQPCTESTYGVTVSTALWPSDVYTPPDCKVSEAAYYSDKPWGQGREECTKWYKENTMLIEVYYERMNYQLLSESEAYTLVNLISDMGGQLGLWMGISVITMVEFISLGILLCMYCCAKRNNVDPEDDEDEKEENPFDGPQKGSRPSSTTSVVSLGTKKDF